MLKAMLKEREVHIGEKDVLVKEMCKQQTTLQVEVGCDTRPKCIRRATCHLFTKSLELTLDANAARETGQADGGVAREEG